MKRITKILLASLLIGCVFTPINLFADDPAKKEEAEADEYFDDYIEKEADENGIIHNGPGDQFILIQAMALFPLNFENQMTVGGAISVGYHRYLLSWLALGGDVLFGYHPTIGSNLMTIIPITVGITFVPTIWKFEFPIKTSIGMAMENYLGYNYFPGLIVKQEAGMFFRMNESWSFGINCQFMYMPQWYAKEPEKNDYLISVSANLGARYHF